MSKLHPHDEPHGDLPNIVARLQAENARLRVIIARYIDPFCVRPEDEAIVSRALEGKP